MGFFNHNNIETEDSITNDFYAYVDMVHEKRSDIIKSMKGNIPDIIIIPAEDHAWLFRRWYVIRDISPTHQSYFETKLLGMDIVPSTGSDISFGYKPREIGMVADYLGRLG